MKRFLGILVGVGIGLTSPAFDAGATTPTFTSGPIVVSSPKINSLPADRSTVVFGYSNGELKVIPYIDLKFQDWWHVHVSIAGGFDGDPAAAYLTPGLPTIMNCGHSATGPGIYCTRAYVSSYPHYEVYDGTPILVGSGTFNPGTSPVLVNSSYRGSDQLYLFARGQDNQIWYAIYNVPTNSWQSWFAIPAPAGDSFSSDPAAWTFSTNNDLIVVCARVALGAQLRCNQQQYVSGGGISWAGWTTVPGQPSTAYKPALTRVTNSVFMFGVRNVVSPNFQEWFTTFPVGGGSYTPFASVSGGSSGFTSGPAAVGSTFNSSIVVMTVGRRSDSAFWYAVGSSPDSSIQNLTWQTWTRIDVP